jgi:membrane associated rhomboid family serine protease
VGPSGAGTTCYRHRDRPTGRRCTRCGRPSCGECLIQAAVGSNCPECVKAAQPDVRTRTRFWSARQPILVTKALMGLNFFVFLWVTMLDPASLASRGITRGHAYLGLSAGTINPGVLFRFGDTVYIAGPGEWYRIVSSGFVHFGVIHIAFNMYLLYMLGQILEPAIGRMRFALVYFSALLAGSAGAMVLQPDGFHGGASGAVFGLMGAAFVGYRVRGINPFATGIGTLLVLNLFITFAIPGISIGGHLGGVVAGAISAVIVMAPSHKAYPKWMTYATPLVVGLVSVAVTVLAINARV